MKSTFDLWVAIILLSYYSYTLIKAYTGLVKFDRITKVPRNKKGGFSLRELKEWSKTELNNQEPDIQKSILFLSLSRYLVYMYLLFVIYSLFFEANHPLNFQSNLTFSLNR